MLTVMHVVGGKKWLIEASSVAEATLNNGLEEVPSVEAYRDGERIACLAEGQVYVMNDSGKTVAAFRLNLPKA